MNDSGFLLISRTVRLPLNKYLKTHANVKITWITESVVPKQYFFYGPTYENCQRSLGLFYDIKVS